MAVVTARHRAPHGALPRKRAILVEAAFESRVSLPRSMKISLSGSTSRWPSTRRCGGAGPQDAAARRHAPFFLYVMPRRSSNSQNFEGAARTPRLAARRSQIAVSVSSGVVSMRPRMKASCVSSLERHGWPCLRASVSPVSDSADTTPRPSRSRSGSAVPPPALKPRHNRRNHATTKVAALASRHHHLLQVTSTSESDQAAQVNPQADSAFVEDALVADIRYDAALI